MKKYIKLGKFLAYILRHKPDDVGIELDKEGFVDVNLLLNAININKKFKEDIVFDDIDYIVKNDNKGRFEIKDKKIRALYGHSIPKMIELNKVTPPNILYHGTTQKALNSILEEGLKPMKRQYVHLSKDIATAIEVGKRRDNNPVVLAIDSKRANENGICFYNANNDTFLCNKILPQYLRDIKDLDISFYDIQKNEEYFANIYSEGNKSLKELLLTCWRKGIITQACCGGHKVLDDELYEPYIAFKIINNDTRLLSHFYNKYTQYEDSFITCSNCMFSIYLFKNEKGNFNRIIDLINSFDKHQGTNTKLDLFYKIAISGNPQNNKNNVQTITIKPFTGSFWVQVFGKFNINDDNEICLQQFINAINDK